jgi:sugar lactone lactonase YvrE
VFHLHLDNKWKPVGLTIAGRNVQGNQLNQLSYPFGICIDDDRTIYIADCWNHRIVEWKPNATNGRIVAGGNGQGDKINQLYRPTNVIVVKDNNCLIISDAGNRRIMQWSRQNNTNGQIIISDIDCYGIAVGKNGSLYVSDSVKNEVRRWKRGDQNGIKVAGGNGYGNNLNQLSYPTFIFVDEADSLYISDRNNHRVMKWMKGAQEGIVVAGGNGKGNSLKQLFLPHAVIVDQFGQIYVADWGNNRVMRWCRGAKEGVIVVDGNRYGYGQEFNKLHGVIDLSFDGEGNLYVVDYNNHRIQKFEIDFD